MESVKLTDEQLMAAVAARSNGKPRTRDQLRLQYGLVWDEAQLAEEFSVVGFLAPFVVCRWNGVMGSLEYQDDPRFYFNWVESEDGE